MSSVQFDIFIILLKLKSYLISMIDDPAHGYDGFELSEEYLSRKYPERKDEILELLAANKISSDAEIAFDELIHQKFKEIVTRLEPSVKLSEILDKYNIIAFNDSIREKVLDEMKHYRDQKLKEIVSVLLQLARIWTQRNEIENNIENFSFLDQEELIRPDELQKLDKLDEDTSVSFSAISKLTQIYLEYLVEYYFRRGGNSALVQFINELEEFRKLASAKYKDLLKEQGFDQNNL